MTQKIQFTTRVLVILAMTLFLSSPLSAKNNLLIEAAAKTPIPQAAFKEADETTQDLLEIMDISLDVIEFSGRKYSCDPNTRFIDLNEGEITLEDFHSGEKVELTYIESTSVIVEMRKYKKASEEHLHRLEEIENLPEEERDETTDKPVEANLSGSSVRFENGKYVN